MTQLKSLVVAGPDPAKHGVVRWRCADLQIVLREAFKVEVQRADGWQALASAASDAATAATA